MYTQPVPANIPSQRIHKQYLNKAQIKRRCEEYNCTDRVYNRARPALSSNGSKAQQADIMTSARHTV